MSLTKNTTRVTIYVLKDEESLPVNISAKIRGTQGGQTWIGNNTTLQPGEANTYWVGEVQDLLLSEARK